MGISALAAGSVSGVLLKCVTAAKTGTINTAIYYGFITHTTAAEGAMGDRYAKYVRAGGPNKNDDAGKI